jgi:alpha-tubulin suppressor-like RCC1 family protein
MPSYSGVWTLQAQMQAKEAGTWSGLPQQLFVWGNNGSGVLGLNDTNNRSSPVQVDGSWSYTAAGQFHSLAVRTGTLWAWGNNATYGALGLGNTTSYSSPKQVGALTNWGKVFSGPNTRSSVAVKADGTLWSWGAGSYGRLGHGNTVNYSSPKQVGALTNWLQVSVNAFCVAVKTDGTLWSWGINASGQLGQNDTTSRSSPVQIGALTDWTTVAVGASHCIATKSNGTLWAWGSSFNGQLGLGNTTNYSSPKQVGALTNWTAVAGAVSNTSFAINANGNLFSWGANGSGQLGLNNTTNYSSPKQIGSLTDWNKVFGGNTNCFAIKSDGTLWSWGLNTSGQLGLSSTTNTSSPIQVGSLSSWQRISASSHTLAIKNS